jgi:hypothetical protein
MAALCLGSVVEICAALKADEALAWLRMAALIEPGQNARAGLSEIASVNP